MKSSEIKKLFHQQLRGELASAGWNFSSKHSMYYRITDNVLNFILTDRRSSGLEVGIYVQPLYIPDAHLVLNLGDSIQHINCGHYHAYALLPTLDAEEIVGNIMRNQRFVLERGIPWLDRVGSPEGICKFIFEKSETGRWFWTSDVRRHEAAAYSKLYLGDVEAAGFHFHQFWDQLKADHSGKWVEDTVDYTQKLMHDAEVDPMRISGVLADHALRLKKALDIQEGVFSHGTGGIS